MAYGYDTEAGTMQGMELGGAGGKGAAPGGFNFGDLTKMLGSPAVKNWLSSPANQRMIADFGQAL